MPDEQDRVLAQLAVESGFLSREEAGRYWQRIQTPGSPRLVPLLVQEGRLTPGQLQELKSRFYSMQQSGSGPAPPPPPPPPPSGRLPKPGETVDTLLEAGKGGAVPGTERLRANATAVDGPATDTFLQAGSDAFSMATQGMATQGTFLNVGARPQLEDSWEEALHKDMLLARVLLDQGVTTTDRLRECRDLQLQHRMRLGVVLVKKGYTDRQTVEGAINQVRRQMGGQSERDFYASESTHMDGPSVAPPPPPAPAAQDALDTVLNTPQGGNPAIPGNAEDALHMGLSVDELNPFADVPMFPNKQAAAAPDPIPLGGPLGGPLNVPGPAPGGPQPLPSVDELDAFSDIPLPPPPGPAPPIVDMQPAGFGEKRTSGFTPTGIPIGGEADSGSTKMKARDKAALQRVQSKRKARKSGGNFPLMLLLFLVAGIGLAVGLYFLIAYLDF